VGADRVTFKRVVIVLAILTALVRVFIEPRLTNIPTFEGTYEALVHMFVGFLIILPIYEHFRYIGGSSEARALGWIGWGLALWEGLWFGIQKYLSVHA
jgi:hypothetical protein